MLVLTTAKVPYDYSVYEDVALSVLRDEGISADSKVYEVQAGVDWNEPAPSETVLFGGVWGSAFGAALVF